MRAIVQLPSDRRGLHLEADVRHDDAREQQSKVAVLEGGGGEHAVNLADSFSRHMHETRTRPTVVTDG
jgi:dihydroxyacetone kinase